MTITEEKNLYLGQSEQLEQELGERDRPWLRRLRKAAIARFQALGFPTSRNEDWKFTSLSPLVRIPFRPAGDSRRRVTAAELAELAGPALPGPRLVFGNGSFVPE